MKDEFYDLIENQLGLDENAHDHNYRNHFLVISRGNSHICFEQASTWNSMCSYPTLIIGELVDREMG